MEQRLDAELDRLDRAAAEDGEGTPRVWCWCCRSYVPEEAMAQLPAMKCAWCENDDRFVEEFTALCERILEHCASRARRVDGIRQAVDMTLREGIK